MIKFIKSLRNKRARKINKARVNQIVVIGVVVFLFSLAFYFVWNEPRTPPGPESNSNNNFNGQGLEKNRQNENRKLVESNLNLNMPENVEVNKTVNVNQTSQAEAAIVIDDFGSGSPKNFPTKDFLSFPGSITFAIIPRLTYSEEVAKAAKAAGYEVLIHQPMEPLDSKINPGTGAILSSMNGEEIKSIVNESIKEIPEAIGLNNHMGSKVTQNEEIMKTIIGTLKEKGLFFIDSLTIDKSVGAKVAKSLGVAHGTRDIFLDDEDKVDYIKSQGEKLIELVQANPKEIPIAIGHNKKNTYEALVDLNNRFKNLGIKMVPVSEAID